MENAEAAEVVTTTPQEAPSIEERFANAMGLEDDPAPEGQPEAQAPEEEASAEETPSVEEPSEDVAEIEYDGETYQVPKGLKDAFLRQQDYTKKTQEVAEQRKAVELEREAFARQQQVFALQQQVQQQNLQSLTKLNSIDSSLKQFEGLDWNSIIDQDPIQAMKLQQQYNALQTQRQSVLQEYMTAQEQANAAIQQTQAEALEKGMEQLKKAIPDFSPEVAKNLRDFGKSVGFSDAELSGVTDPRAVVVLHKAAMYDQLMKSKPEVSKKVATAPKTLQVKAQAPKQSQSDVLKKIVKTSKDRHSKHAAIQKLMERMV